MLYREIIAVCSQILTKHISTLCGQNVELLNVKTCGFLPLKCQYTNMKRKHEQPDLKYNAIGSVPGLYTGCSRFEHSLGHFVRNPNLGLW